MEPIDLTQAALGIAQQTRVGRRQLATAQVLAATPHPLAVPALLHLVEAALGRRCYGRQPVPTLWGDLQVLKRAGLPIRYSRKPGACGYYIAQSQPEAAARAAQLLRRIGWQPSDWMQIAGYARMAPAMKLAQMWALRRGQMRLLAARLQRERPQLSPADLARAVQAHLALLAEEDRAP